MVFKAQSVADLRSDREKWKRATLKAHEEMVVGAKEEQRLKEAIKAFHGSLRAALPVPIYGNNLPCPLCWECLPAHTDECIASTPYLQQMLKGK